MPRQELLLSHRKRVKKINSNRKVPKVACRAMTESTKNNCVISLYKRKSFLFLPPFISRWNALLMGLPVVNGHSVLSFQPPFICKTSSGFWTFSIILYGRGGPMCPPNDPNNLKWTVLRQTHGSAPTENGRLKRGVESTQGIVKGLGKRGWREDEGMCCHS